MMEIIREPRVWSQDSTEYYRERYRARERELMKKNWGVPYCFVPKSYSYNLHLVISITFLAVIVLMLAYMVNTIFSNVPNSVECLKEKKKFSSEKLRAKQKNKNESF